MQCPPPFELPAIDTEARAVSRTVADTREFVYELKFYIAPEGSADLLHWVRSQLAPDPHGGGAHGDTYQVSSIYFDTTAHDVLARRGSFARCKYRVRRYGESEQVFLERKTRGRYRVFKRRSAIAAAALPQLLAARPAREWSGYWFHRRLLARELHAVSRVDYQRIARIGQSSYGPLRLTLDQHLVAWHARAPAFDGQGAGVPLSGESGDRLILELKFGHAMPAVFKILIREFDLRLAGISKYRLASQALGLAPPASRALRAPVPASSDAATPPSPPTHPAHPAAPAVREPLTPHASLVPAAY